MGHVPDVAVEIVDSGRNRVESPSGRPASGTNSPAVSVNGIFVSYVNAGSESYSADSAWRLGWWFVLIWISGDLLFPQLVIAALASGIVLDSLRASTYSPWWSLTMLAIGVFVGIWRRYMRERVTDRTYLIRMYAPVAIIGAFAVTFIPYAPILNVLDWRRALIELIIHGILLAVGLMLIRSFSKVYG